MENIDFISEKLLLFRKRNKLSQQEMADKIGVSRTHYSGIERSSSMPSLKTLISIDRIVPIFLK